MVLEELRVNRDGPFLQKSRWSPQERVGWRWGASRCQSPMELENRFEEEQLMRSGNSTRGSTSSKDQMNTEQEVEIVL